MPGFFARTFSAFLGALVALLLVGGLALLVLVGLVAAGDAPPPVPDPAVLVVDLAGPLREEPPLDPLEELASDLPTVREVVRGLEMAAADDRVAAVWLRPDGVRGSWAALEEVRTAIAGVRAAGTPVYALSGARGYDEAGYFLATAADSIFSPPVASFELDGFAAEVLFYADLLDRLGIEARAVRAGAFKSAAEPFTRTSLSEENAFQLRALLADRSRRFRTAVAEGRGLTPAAVEALIDAGTVRAAPDAEDAGLLDARWYESDLTEHLAARLGLADDEDLPTLHLDDYLRTSAERAGLDVRDDARLAVVYATGTILPGESGPDGLGGLALGADTFADAVDDALADPDVAALVVRVDSPGGDATAADVMWQAVAAAAETVPVVVSMGGVAASGGYYLAAPADAIVADPLTVTGSIGVFALLFDASDFATEELYLAADTVKTAPFATLYSPLTPLTDTGVALLQQDVDRIYETFLARVAEGRGLPRDSVEALAGGRVYSGEDAQAVGLVDELGGLDHALARAAEFAGLEPGRYRLRLFPQPPPLFDRLVGQFLGGPSVVAADVPSSLAPDLRAWIRRAAPVVEAARLHAVPQARLPWTALPGVSRVNPQASRRR